VSAKPGSGDFPDALGEALAFLRPDAAIASVEPLGSGHIHLTYAVRCRGERGEHQLVVQRINTAVFGDPLALGDNLRRVTEHVRSVQRERRVPDPERRCLRALAGPGGGTVHRARDGSWWRAFDFVRSAHAVERLASPAQAEEVGRAFGGFLADLDGLPPDRIRETIPDFHDLAKRLDALEDAAGRDAAGRAVATGAELDRARRLAERLLASPAAALDALPLRLVHNDCKLNNLLLDDRTGEVLCVVDLDTVMPGYALFDFGDLARSGAGQTDEDEREPARVRFDPALFRALATGFVAGARGCLTEAEIRSFSLAAPRIALELATRFLTDHLAGDRYFRIARPGQNLDRARVQLRLAELLLEFADPARELFDALARHSQDGIRARG